MILSQMEPSLQRPSQKTLDGGRGGAGWGGAG